MTSMTSISRMALGHIGISVTLSNIESDTSKEARQCNVYYTQCRDRILEQVDWGFARKRAPLSVSSISPPDGWAYAYDYPADCVAARRIVNKAERTPGKGQKIPFAVHENAASGMKLILTDEADAELEYTISITNPAMFSHLFVECLSWDLAAHVAGPLRADASLKKEAAQNAAGWIGVAAASALGEEQEDEEPDSEFVTARG